MEFVAINSLYFAQATLWGAGGDVSWEDARTSASLDNRYFMAALSSITAEGTHILEHIFLTSEVTSGVYALRLFLRGKPWVVTVDDKFWAEDDGLHLHLKFAAIYRDHVWAPVLEKAWAKVMGTYAATAGGHAVDALHALTGAPVFQLLTSAHATGAAVFADVEASVAKGYLITACTKAATGASGLASNKYFSVIDTFRLATNTIELILVRDPSGLNTYAGTYKHPLSNPTVWTSALLAEVSYLSYIRGDPNEVRVDDSLFFISSDEFLEAFETYQVAHYRYD